MSEKFIKDAKLAVAVGDVVKVRVIGVDLDQKRISVSMKNETESPVRSGGRRKQGNKKQKGPTIASHSTIADLKMKFNKDAGKKKKPVKLQHSLKSIMRSGR